MFGQPLWFSQMLTYFTFSYTSLEVEENKKGGAFYFTEGTPPKGHGF